MYKHFQAGNAQIICNLLNENKMKIHSIESSNGSIQCIGEPSDDNREIKQIAGSVLSVTKGLNDYERKIEGKVLINGHRATAFYRVDEKKEAELKAKMEMEAKKAKEAAERAEKEAKKAEMKKAMDELKRQMESVDSELSDSQKEEKAAKEKADKKEAARQAEIKKSSKKKADKK